MELEKQEMLLKIKAACAASFGVLESGFLCQSIGTLSPKEPLCLREDRPVREALTLLQDNKIGCIIVTRENGTVSGIFTERDCLLKVVLKVTDYDSVLLSEVMTADPVCESNEATIAYALNLMSGGGFRHIPIVDAEKRPIGILSVKDIVDHIANRLVDDILAFQLPEI